jgi:hypothetical protein
LYATGFSLNTPNQVYFNPNVGAPQAIIEALRPSREDNKAVDKLFFLMSLNVNAHGESVNHVTNQREWQDILTTARANGWKPLGTMLNYEFQYQLKASHCEELTFDTHTLIDQYVKDKCGKWKGSYLSPECQIVTDDNAR